MVAGLIDIDALQGASANGEIDTVVVAFPDLYGRLMGKRLDAGFFCETYTGGVHACDYLLTVDMEMEPVPGYAFANWESGYGDIHLQPDLATMRVASWLDRTAIVLCDAHMPDHSPVNVAPRSILGAQTTSAAAAGFEVAAATELEYYLFRTTYADAARADYNNLAAAGWYLEDYNLLQGTRTEDLNGSFRRHLAASGIPVEATKGEWGRGQHEINMRYASALEMADRHAVLKQAIKEIAEANGAAATFMAKIDETQAGSSSHMHMSLWRDGTSAFATSDDTFRWFLGGWLAHAAELSCFYAPTVNSYKRYQPQSWAPTAIAWSSDNRTAGFRVVGAGESLRIECRIPGADVNPYLGLAAAIASGLDGIANKTEPPPEFVGDVYAAGELPQVPSTLADATDRLERSEFARRAFGDDVIEHYVHFFRTENAAYDRAVTDWERKRYFERI